MIQRPQQLLSPALPAARPRTAPIPRQPPRLPALLHPRQPPHLIAHPGQSRPRSHLPPRPPPASRCSG